MRTSSGFILLALLPIIAMLALLEMELSFLFSQRGQLKRAQEHRLVALERLPQEITSVSPSYCKEAQLKSGATHLFRQICSLTSKANLPLINFALQNESCLDWIDAQPETTVLGNTLTLSSSRAQRTCVALEDSSPVKTVAGNLSLSTLVLKGDSPIAIITRGYTEILSLSVEQELLIVAGGEIKIGTIVAGKPAPVSLLSTLGSVIVESSDVNAQVKALGRYGSQMGVATLDLAEIPAALQLSSFVISITGLKEPSSVMK